MTPIYVVRNAAKRPNMSGRGNAPVMGIGFGHSALKERHNRASPLFRSFRAEWPLAAADTGALPRPDLFRRYAAPESNDVHGVRSYLPATIDKLAAELGK